MMGVCSSSGDYCLLSHTAAGGLFLIIIIIKTFLQAIGDFDIPLETCNVPQFAFAAFSGVAAGHKVNSSWRRCM